MKLIKKTLLFALFLVVIMGGMYWSETHGHLENTPLANIPVAQSIDSFKNSSEIFNFDLTSLKTPETKDLADFAQDASNQTKILSSRTQEVGEHTQNILGTTTEVEEEPLPIHERALEYGRYLYCNEVVKDYEKRFDVEETTEN